MYIIGIGGIDGSFVNTTTENNMESSIFRYVNSLHNAQWTSTVA